MRPWVRPALVTHLHVSQQTPGFKQVPEGLRFHVHVVGVRQNPDGGEADGLGVLNGLLERTDVPPVIWFHWY